MNTILKLRSARADSHPRSRVLAIEADPARVALLRHILSAHVGADFQIVQSVNEALKSIAHHIPDLVLTSTFLPPRDEATLTMRLMDMQGAEDLQVITTPYFIDWEDSSSEGGKIVKFWKRRRALLRPACDSETVGRQIEAYLQQAHARRLSAPARELRERPRRPVVLPMRRMVEQRDGGLKLAEVPAQAHLSGNKNKGIDATNNDRRRAKRRISGDVPSLWSVNLPVGGLVRLVNISSHGVLLETTSKIPPGRTVDLQLIGEGMDLSLPARTTRSEVAAVDGTGVRYRVAAVFSRELDMPGVEPKIGQDAVLPGTLADLLARVLRDLESGGNADSARRTFERGLRRLVTADDVQIRQTPVIPRNGSESIYFTVPVRSDRPPILQTIFEADRLPSALEFKLLRAAANLAAVVLEFAPLDQRVDR